MKIYPPRLIRPVYSRFRRLCAGTLPVRTLTLGSAALIALSGSVQAQAVDGTDGVTMGGSAVSPTGSGTINGLSVNTFPGQANLPWTNQNLSGFVVPAGQFTGIALDGSDVAFPDLLPIRAQSLSVASSTDVTADVVQINQNGVTTGTLNLLDHTSVDRNDDPVTHAITIDNGELQLNGQSVSGPAASDDYLKKGYTSPRSGFLQNDIYSADTDNFFFLADRRFTVTQDGFSDPRIQELFDGEFDSNNQWNRIFPGESATINFDLLGKNEFS